MTPAKRTGNEALKQLLAEAGLSPRGLARCLNATFGAATVAETAPYHWTDAGGVPRDPLPSLVTFALSRQLGRRLTVAEVWQGRASDSMLFLPAVTGMAGPWTLGTTMVVAEDWLLGGMVDRRTFLAVSGAGLVQAVGHYLDDVPDVAVAALPHTYPDDPIVAQIEASVPRLQLLDDERGGGAGLTYVGAQVRAALLVLREGGHSDKVRRRLLTAITDLCQLAGWMAFDAGQHGLAQRYFFTGLRTAHSSGYRAMEAHVLADLAFQSVSLGSSADGVLLAEAAARVARSEPASVRASVKSRLAHAYAGAGRVHDCERAWQDAQDDLAKRLPHLDPDWMYYLTPNHLDCQAGYSLVLAGRQALRNDNRSAGRKWLRTGTALLETGAHARALDQPSQRRALYEGTWLALGYTSLGRLEDACRVTQTALTRLDQVRSPRSTDLLNQLRTDLRRRARSQPVADLLPQLESALAVA